MPLEPEESASSLTPAAREAILRLLAHRTMLKTYLLSIVHDHHLAEDALSETTVQVLQAWPRFDATRPFGPWARGIARRVALAILRQRRRGGTTLGPEVLESLGAAIEDLGDEVELEERRQRLRHCVEKLPERERDLVRLRYFESTGYEELTGRTGRTRAALYMAFRRIHRRLADCLGASR